MQTQLVARDPVGFSGGISYRKQRKNERIMAGSGDNEYFGDTLTGSTHPDQPGRL